MDLSDLKKKALENLQKIIPKSWKKLDPDIQERASEVIGKTLKEILPPDARFILFISGGERDSQAAVMQSNFCCFPHLYTFLAEQLLRIGDSYTGKDGGGDEAKEIINEFTNRLRPTVEIMRAADEVSLKKKNLTSEALLQDILDAMNDLGMGVKPEDLKDAAVPKPIPMVIPSKGNIH